MSRESSQTPGPESPAVSRLVNLNATAYDLAAHLLGSRQGAEDVVQQAYLQALVQIRAGNEPQEERPWFLRVVANVAKNWRTQEARRRKREAVVRQAAQTESLPGERLVAALRRELWALDEKHRLPLMLCYERGLSQHEAAAVLDVPQRTVSRRIGEGLALLRKALARAGHTLAPAAVIGALAHAAPPVPASLAAAVDKIVAGEVTEVTAAGSGAGSAAAAAKGGRAMKIVLGVLLTGALAGGAALLAGGGNGAPASPPAKSEPVQGPPQMIHYALAAYWDYLDGPRLGAMAMSHRDSMCDDGDNLYILTAVGLQALRCVRASGMVETITGDDRPLGDLGMNEGPAAFLPRLSASASFGGTASWMSVRGTPYEGEDKGAIYIGPHGRGAPVGGAYRVFRNKAQGGRWWFKQLSFGELTRPFKVSVESDGKSLGIVCDGNYYRYDEAKGTITPLLVFADYKDQTAPARGAEDIVRAEDGAFYLYWRYYGGKETTGIHRISADKSKCEFLIKKRLHNEGPGWTHDGPGMTSGYFDGPYIHAYRPPHTLFLNAVDDGLLRRWRDGRVATYSDKEGEWREYPKKPGFNQLFKGWCMGPRGSNYVYNTYNGQCKGGDDRIFKIGPIDFDKATVGPLVQAKGE